MRPGTLAVQLYSVIDALKADRAALRAGNHLRRHITEIDRKEADRFELLAADLQALLAGGLTIP